MPKLKIKTLTIRNFRSYGDYDTTITIEGLGPVLILGQNKDDPSKANGVGKSTIVDAIIWTLFGRLPGNRQSQITPGDWIINEKVGERCSCKIHTEDGYIIERTRKFEGHNDLLILDNQGNDISKSTNKTAQEQLQKLFCLDYDLFMNGRFFAQSAMSFLELPDTKRKKALERMLNLTKFDQYAAIAKEKFDLAEKIQIKHVADAEAIGQEIIRISQLVEDNIKLHSEWESGRETRINEVTKKYEVLNQKFKEKENEILKKITDEEGLLNDIKTCDIDNLRKAWDIYEKNCQLLLDVGKKLEKLAEEIKNLQAEKTNLEVALPAEEFDTQIDALQKQIDTAQAEIKKMLAHDIENIKATWKEYDDILAKEEILGDEISEMEKELTKDELGLQFLDTDIKKWKDQAGKICVACKQPISAGHVHKLNDTQEIKRKELINKIDEQKKAIKVKKDEAHKLSEKSDEIQPSLSISEAISANKERETKQANISLLQKNKADLQKRKSQAQQDLQKRQTRIKEIIGLVDGKTKVLTQKREILNNKKEAIEKTKPKLTANEATLLKQQYDQKLQYIEELRQNIVNLSKEKDLQRQGITDEINQIKQAINPYQKIIDDLKEELNKTRDKRTKSSEAVTKYNYLLKHINYIHKAYSDRRRIRSFVMSQLIPYFNARIAYYLDTFDCDYRLEFNSFLQTKSDKWPYELWSGGQKRRIDLAVMLAIHDLHESIYGEQCNILVFDEYDKSLDENGIYAFVNLLFKDFSKKPVLIISHNHRLQDMFPSKIIVKLEDDLSYVEEIR